MDVFRICGGAHLTGEVDPGGAKNAALPILAASMLSGEKVTIRACPDLADIGNMLRILGTLGCSYSFRGGIAEVDTSGADSWDMPDMLSKKLRSSIFMLGPLIGRFRRACVTYPGGCDIGLRPIDLHLKGLRALGVRIRERHGRIYCDCDKLRGGDVYLDLPSVGATENVMMAAVLAKGRTHIHNAAREPEVADLAGFINAMGGKVAGAGTDCIVIDGVDALHGADYRPIPDRIVTGTLMAACAATGGKLTIDNAPVSALGAVIDKLRACGCMIDTAGDRLFVESAGRIKAFDISTQYYPGFPTDLQAQFTALACTAEGTSLIVENLFENRFGHVSQLARMGADIKVSGRLAVVRGGFLTGASMNVGDLRGGAGLVIAALSAEGESIVRGVNIIDRGYERLERMLSALGADIRRETETED